MNFTKIKYFLFFLLISIVSCSDNNKFESPNMPLWEITNKQGESSYLLGTSEYLPKDSAKILFNELIIASFDSAEVFVTQIDVPNSDFGSAKLALEIPENKMMKEYLNELEYDKLTQLKRGWKYGESSSIPNPDSTRLRLLFYLHDMIYFNNQSNFYFDKFWMERAMPMQKKIGGLETYQKYYESFEVMNKAEEVEFMNSITSVDAFVDSLRYKCQNKYMMGEFDELNKMYVSLFPYLETHFDNFIGDKHDLWAEKIGASVDSASTFVTLDVFHMFGKSNLIDVLLSKGYQVNRIQ